MKVGLILARSRNGVIGRGGKLPWHLPEDLKHFKAVTTGCPVIMGRKTWESLPEKFRPLPDRTNIVMTRDVSYIPKDAWCCTKPEVALKLAARLDAKVVYVIGGEDMYRLFEPYTDFACVTEIHEDYVGDTYGPRLTGFFEKRRKDCVSSTGLKYSIVWYQNPRGKK